MADEFDWEKDKDAVVFPTSRGVSVYRNEAGDVVIRQERHPLENDDDTVIIPRVHLHAVIVALVKHAKD